jgi:hypothetical protein
MKENEIWGHAACMGVTDSCIVYVWSENLKGRDNLEDRHKRERLKQSLKLWGALLVL